MCDLTHHHADFGFIVAVPEIRALIDETRRLSRTIPDHAARVEALRPAFSRLLAADGWLPDEFAKPDQTSGMGGGIGQYALYRDEAGELCLFSLVVPAGSSTPVHDHLAWGLVGVYRGAQLDTTYARLDDGRDETRAMLEVAKQQTVEAGQFYTLLPPDGDIHYVKTVSVRPNFFETEQLPETAAAAEWRVSDYTTADPTGCGVLWIKTETASVSCSCSSNVITASPRCVAAPQPASVDTAGIGSAIRPEAESGSIRRSVLLFRDRLGQRSPMTGLPRSNGHMSCRYSTKPIRLWLHHRHGGGAPAHAPRPVADSVTGVRQGVDGGGGGGTE